MRLQGTASMLRSAGAQIKVVKAIVKAMANDDMRILLPQEKLDELKDIAVQIGSDIATIESYLYSFRRFHPSAKVFILELPANLATSSEEK